MKYRIVTHISAYENQITISVPIGSEFVSAKFEAAISKFTYLEPQFPGSDRTHVFEYFTVYGHNDIVSDEWKFITQFRIGNLEKFLFKSHA